MHKYRPTEVFQLDGSFYVLFSIKIYKQSNDQISLFTTMSAMWYIYIIKEQPPHKVEAPKIA
jgi:hypothetical protein